MIALTSIQNTGSFFAGFIAR